MSVQSIARAVTILRLIATRDSEGTRLRDLFAEAGLTKATAHRILTALCEEKLVEFDPQTRRYHIGLGLVVLGACAAGPNDVRGLARPTLERLAERTGDTAYLWARENGDAVCLHRAEGGFPIRVLTWDIGYRRPLGIGAGSLALLAGLDDLTIKRIVVENRDRRSAYGQFEDAAIFKLVAETRACGYAYARGLVVHGMSAIGVAVSPHRGPPQLALSIASITERLNEVRRREMAKILQEEAALLASRLSPDRYAREDKRQKTGARQESRAGAAEAQQ